MQIKILKCAKNQVLEERGKVMLISSTTAWKALGDWSGQQQQPTEYLL